MSATDKIRCEECNLLVDMDEIADWENQHCEACRDRWLAEQYAYWKPLYDGEKAAGLLEENQ